MAYSRAAGGLTVDLILESGITHKLDEWEILVLDAALAGFSSAKEQASYFDEETRQAVYAAYERLRAIVPYRSNESCE